MHHQHLLGPTGTGKSTALLNLILQDADAGHSVIVLDPQGDLVGSVLARLPASRHDDVVVLDAVDPAPVGFNPLAAYGRRPELIADSLLAVFKALYAESWGPRTNDILAASLMTLCQRTDATIVMLPLLLTNTGFRRSLTKQLRDPIALQPFWYWYESLSVEARNQAIAPVLNKLRQWLLNPHLRAVLGQREPRSDLRDVFTRRRILLVSLAEGRLGPEAAALLGSLVVAEIWQATRERTDVHPSRRHPVMVYLDEFATFMHLPVALGDALARSRSMGVGYVLAHQYLNQLDRSMHDAVLANTRSRVLFQLSPNDAHTIARMTPDLVADDFTALSAYEVYASLFAGGRTTPFALGRTLPPSPAFNDVAALRAGSRARYGVPLNEVEAGFASLINNTENDLGPTGRKPRGGAS